jgi:hypothetical protein
MYNGRITRKGTLIEGSYRQNAYDDVWQEAHAIHGDVDLTDPKVVEAIQKAWNNHPSNQPTSLYGNLRAAGGNYFNRIDPEARVLITTNSCRLCD